MTRSLVLMAPLDRVSMRRVEKPLPLPQSRLIVVAHLTFLIAITLVWFGVGQARLLRQDPADLSRRVADKGRVTL